MLLFVEDVTKNMPIPGGNIGLRNIGVPEKVACGLIMNNRYKLWVATPHRLKSKWPPMVIVLLTCNGDE